MTQNREYRFLSGPVEIRAVDGKPSILTGRAVVYNMWSDLIYGHFRERILPGAFDESLADGHDIIATIDHDARRLLGRTSSNTLRLRSGADGVDVENDFPDLTYARDLSVSIQRGDIRGMSFIFDVKDDSWETREGVPHRSVGKAEIYEVTWTGFPAYPDSEAGLRMACRSMAQKSLLNEMLRRRLELAERVM
jgi:HK97 family phage prohead protease